MRCNEFKENALLFLDDRLDATTREKMHAHLSACVDCALYYNRLGQLWQTGLPSTTVSPGFERRVLAALQQKSHPADRVANWLQSRLGPVFRPAAALALILISLMLGRWLATPATTANGQPDTPQETLVWAEFYETLARESLPAVYLSLGEESDE